MARRRVWALGGAVVPIADDGGGRWDHMERTARSPQFRAAYQLRESTRMQASWGQAVQFPDFLQGVEAGCCRSGLRI